MQPLTLVKAHAFGNDFLLLDAAEVEGDADLPALARAVCERHRGIGADGMIVFRGPVPRANVRGTGPLFSMRLLNADGSHSEISGNGVRCLAALIARREGLPRGAPVDVDTDAGIKRLALLAIEDGRYTFRAAMGQPEQIARRELMAAGRPVDVVTLRVGNPQCVVLGPVTEERLHTIASALAVHPAFPEGTNVELAAVETPGRVRILIWERGVGPTEASGTGACAAAVAAMRYGGAARDVEVVAPGGAQRVEWRDDGVYITGWAEIVADGTWLRDLPRLGG